jgi:hypothetical protein
MTADVHIAGVAVPLTESCRFSESEIEIAYQLWDAALPIAPQPGASIEIVLHSGVIDQVFTGVIDRVLSTIRVSEHGAPRLNRTRTILSLSSPIRFSAVGVAPYRAESDRA